jgi:Lrp/AsnC family leucine-responsive transcriptional regulator
LSVDLDGTDIAILKSLMEDGRKSFRAISREIRVSTPTVKSRYERLVNIGLIKSVKPDIDLSKVYSERKTSTLEKKPSSSWRNKRSTSMQK